MSSQARQLLQLLRLHSNRNCADCDAPLSDSTNVWASTTHGVFICVNCVSVHRKIGVHISRVRSVNHDVWTDEEIANMKHSGGNATFNSTYERYVPRGIPKPTPDASYDDRETWIRAKYELRAFIIPLHREEDRKQGGKKKAAKEARDLAAAAKTNLPMRLVDYLVVVGLDIENCIVLSPKPTDFFTFSPHPVSSPSGVGFAISSPLSTPLSTPTTSSSSQQVITGAGAMMTMSSSGGGQHSTSNGGHVASSSSMPSRAHSSFPPEAVKMTCRVIDHYPDPELYADDGPSGCPIPEHAAPFVYPDGYMLSSEELAPTFFSFVLTNVNGVRSYGCALRFYEELDSLANEATIRAAIIDAFDAAELDIPSWLHKAEPSTTLLSSHHAIGHSISSSASTISAAGGGGAGSSSPSLFLPKSLVLLSHYPFFAVFREVLLEIYRISISSAPLPIERYIANFVCEVPLPPQGQVEVKFALPDRTLTISRPPRNRLPMVAFSMRPLFTILNVDNILLIFGLLLTETKVALCSAHYSLLTPVAEAFLALLFPFVWQGAFIPVMPLAMTDILDAPVPFFVGLHRRYLDSTPASHRPSGVVFVDLDNDEVYLGYDDDKQEPRIRPRLPDRETHKLRQKLLEHGGVAFNPRAPEVEGADLAFPNNEHHLPISSFATEQGMTQKSSGATGVASVMSTFGGFGSKLGSRGGTGGGRSEASKSAKSLAATLGSKHMAGATLNVSIMNEQNNEGMPDRFSASEVRAAFLRFFVSVFRNYQQYVYSAPSGADPSPPPGGEAFNREAFLKESTHLSDSSTDTLNLMLSSQMYERFIEERIINPHHPQIKFFDESINAKLNRAKTQLVKRETPFLDDSTDQITETFNPPPPSNWGLPDTGEGYTYAHFPHLRTDLFGNIRKPRRLFKFPEQQRTGSKSVTTQVYQRSLSNIERTSATSPHATPRRGRMDMLRDLSHKKVDKTLRGIIIAQKKYRMHRCRRRYKALRRVTILVQRHVRSCQSCRMDRGRYMERRQQIISIQSVLRRRLAYKEIARRRKAYEALQRWGKMAIIHRAYRRKYRAIVRIQAFFRSRRARKSFLVIRDFVIGAQAVMRGWLQRKLAARERKQRLTELRRQIFHLWKLAHTPLTYRSRFWMVFDGTGFLHLAIHEDETIKLWKDLGFYNREHRRSFVNTFRDVDILLKESEEARTRTAAEASSSTIALADAGRRLSLRAVPELGGGRSSMRLPATPLLSGSRHVKSSSRGGVNNFDFAISLQYAAVTDVKHLAVAAERLEGERHQLYLAMKAQSSEGTRGSFFHMFGLETQKKRKRHLCQMVWQDLDRAEASAQVVLGTVGMDLSKDWVQTKLDQRIRSDLLNTVQACLISIRHQKKSYRRMKTRVLTHEQLHENAWKASHLVIKGGHRRKQSSMASLGSISPSPFSNALATALLQQREPTSPGRQSPSEQQAWDAAKPAAKKAVTVKAAATTATSKDENNNRKSVVLKGLLFRSSQLKS